MNGTSLQSTVAIMRKAIVYRSTHRGTKEADWLIGGFIHKHLEHLPDAEIPSLKSFIDLDDDDFFKQINTPNQKLEKLARLFREYKEGL